MVHRYEAGETTQQIGNRYGISKTRVATVLREQDITIRRQGLTEEQTAEVVKLYAAGESLGPTWRPVRCFPCDHRCRTPTTRHPTAAAPRMELAHCSAAVPPSSDLPSDIWGDRLRRLQSARMLDHPCKALRVSTAIHASDLVLGGTVGLAACRCHHRRDKVTRSLREENLISSSGAETSAMRRSRCWPLRVRAD